MESRTVAPVSRAAVFAAVCTLLAVAAHLPMSGGSVPVPVVLVGALTVFCFALVAACLGERGLGSITALVGGSQLGLHLLFQVAQSSAAGTAPMSATDPMPGMAGMAPMTGMPGMPSAPMGMTDGMIVAHVLAAGAAAWWLRRGEAVVFALARRTRTVLAEHWRDLLACWSGRAGLVRPVAPAGAVPVVAACGPVVARLLRFAVSRRGPPAAVCR